MNKFELYDEVAIDFPAMWPMSPHLKWVNIHDGQLIKANLLAELLSSAMKSMEVIVVVHSCPGEATRLPIESAPAFLARFILLHDVQVSDAQLTRFVSVSRLGVATCDA